MCTSPVPNLSGRTACEIVGCELMAKLDDEGFIILPKHEYWRLAAASESQPTVKAHFQYLADRARAEAISSL